MSQRITHDFMQGSDAWVEFRLTHHGASEAAAMLGISPKVKRNELLHMKFTQTPKEFSDWMQENILDPGHEKEALARPYIEARLGEDLYPVTMSIGDISASCDGLTMDERTAWEHKQWNAALAESLEHGELPDEYMPQAQQVLMVTGADKLIFTCSDGTDENMVSLEIKPNRAWFDNITDGWNQFRKDLAEYVPVAIPEKPKADAIMALPALAVQIRGEVLTSNLPAFKAAAEKFIAGIKMDLETDEDFANGDATVKFCDAKEKEIVIAMDAAIAQMASIDEMMRTGNYVKDQLRTKRLALSKQIETRKTQIKESAVAERRLKYVEHIASLNAELGDVSIVVASPDFVSAIKGLKTIASLYDKLDTALANGKIAADAAAKDLRAKLDWHKQNAEYAFLFHDLQTLIQKPTEDFQLTVTTRIAEHKRQEVEKEVKRKADEAAQPIIETAIARPMDPSPIAVGRPAMTRTTPTSAPTLRLGQINERLAPIALTAEGLATLGFKHAATDKAAKLYHEETFPQICAALIRHVQAAAQGIEKAA